MTSREADASGNACHDCAVCTERLELSRGKGRDAQEAAALDRTCPTCRHRLYRHLHGSLRATGAVVTENAYPADRPPPDSRLGQMLVELGEYDSYFETLRRRTETQVDQTRQR